MGDLRVSSVLLHLVVLNNFSNFLATFEGNSQPAVHSPSVCPLNSSKAFFELPVELN